MILPATAQKLPCEYTFYLHLSFFGPNGTKFTSKAALPISTEKSELTQSHNIEGFSAPGGHLKPKRLPLTGKLQITSIS